MKYRVIAIILGVLAALNQTAAAAEPDPGPAEDLKSTSAGLRYALFGTLVPMAGGGLLVLAGTGNHPNEPLIIGGAVLGGLGLIVGPGMGHAYAGDGNKLTRGAGLRLLGAAIAGLGVFAVLAADDPYVGSGNPGAGVFPIVAGGSLMLYSGIKDIASTDEAVERYNASLAQASVSVVPAYLTGCDATGIAVSVRF
jgi:hypothetical protein